MRSGLLVLLLALAPTAVAAADAPAPPALQVTLVGTGDPLPRIDRFGPATLVVSGEHTLLFDVGRGTLQRLRQVGVSTGSLDAIFLTHLHSDHVVGLVDLWLSGWVVNARDRPLKLYGPVGTRAMVEHLAQAFAFDIDMRVNEARRNREGARIEVVEIGPGTVWEQDGVVVQAFAVDHGPVAPAFGFRVDHGGHAVALSGDTRFSESLIEHAAGVDLLVHEVAEASEAFKREHPGVPRLSHHTQARDAGRVFAAVKPKLAVYSHLVLVDPFDAATLPELTRETYDGKVLVGEDLMSFAIGDDVRVTGPPAD